MSEKEAVYLSILQSIELFQDIPELGLENLVSTLKEEVFSAGSLIFDAGEPGDCLYIVYRGRLAVLLDGLKVAEIAERETFGEFSLLNSEPRNASIQVLEDCQLLRLDQNDFYEIMGNNISFMKSVIKILIHRLGRQNHELIQTLKKRESYLTQKVEERTQELQTAFEQIDKQKTILEHSYQEIVKQKDEIEEKNHQITESILYAEKIQKSILPSRESISLCFPQSFILFQPRDVVSGDFFWFYHYKQDGIEKILIAAIDCTGHGVPGAFMSMIGNSLLNDIIKVRKILETDKILEELHEGVRLALQQETSNNRDGMDMTICSWDPILKVLEFSGANNPLIYLQNGELFEIRGDRKSIGGYQKEDQRSFKSHQLRIHQPTSVYIFSDGYLHQFGGEENKKFSTKRFKELLKQIHQKDFEMQLKILKESFDEWKGKNSQLDDVLVIGFSV
jgi:CRP-like cAMP-binding protein